MQLRKNGLKKIQVCGIHTLRSQCWCGTLAKANISLNGYYRMAPTLVVSEATIVTRGFMSPESEAEFFLP